MEKTITIDELTEFFAENFGASYWPGKSDVTIFGESPRDIAEKAFTKIGPHPHEHTTHALRDVIEALPRYDIGIDLTTGWQLLPAVEGPYVKLEDVRAVVHKAATLGAPVAYHQHVWRSQVAPGIWECDCGDIKRATSE